MLGKGWHHQFTWLIEFIAVFVLCCIAGAVFAVATSAESLMFSSGANACAFASTKSCLNDYAGYFGGSSELTGSSPMLTTIYFIPVVMLARGMYRVARSSLYAMQEFKYMVKVSCITFTTIFLPATIIMAFLSQSPLVALLVMTLPQ